MRNKIVFISITYNGKVFLLNCITKENNSIVRFTNYEAVKAFIDMRKKVFNVVDVLPINSVSIDPMSGAWQYIPNEDITIGCTPYWQDEELITLSRYHSEDDEIINEKINFPIDGSISLYDAVQIFYIKTK